MKRSVVLSSIVAVGVVAVAGRALLAQQPAPAGPNVAQIANVTMATRMTMGTK